MSTPVINTKVELVVEAIESLAIAAAARATNPDGASFFTVLDARKEAAAALRDFLQPILRVVVVLALAWPLASHARPLYPGAWSRIAESTGEFLSNQKRPPMKPWTGEWRHDSCCGPADAYEADEFDTQDGELWAIITEGDTSLKEREALATQPYCGGLDDTTGMSADNDGACKTRVPPGVRIRVPKDRIIEPDPEHPNITGHGWIWLSSGKDVFCYTYPSAL